MGSGVAFVLWAVSCLQGLGPAAYTGSGAAPEGRVRILRFEASVGTLVPGQKAMLCYGVENAKAVHIAPLPQSVQPAVNRCLEVVPMRTTHYTILAEGFDGTVASRSLTLPVEAAPASPPGFLQVAEYHLPGCPL